MQPRREWLDRARLRVQQHLINTPETPAEHIRTVLQLIRFFLDHGEPVLGSGTPAVIVHVTDLGRLQARLEAALEQVEATPVTLRIENPQ